MTPNRTVVLSRSDVQQLIDFKDLIPALEQVFCQYGNGQTLGTGLLHMNAVDGDFHIKAGGYGKYFGVKVNGGFFQNQARYGIPAIQGCIVLSDATSGYPLAVLDSVEITGQRTAATTALAALHLAKKTSRVLTVFGTGRQGRLHVEGMVQTLELEQVYVVGRDHEKAEHLAQEMALLLRIPIEATENAAAAVEKSDIVVTCTPSQAPLFSAVNVRPGTFVAAIGADGPGKQELDPALFERSTIVVDILSQCVKAGEFQHALKDGRVTDQVAAELGEVIALKKPGRVTEDEIIIFDSTGTALQDVAAAALVYERALETCRGNRINLFE
jgi:alanine dehydrogenase